MSGDSKAMLLRAAAEEFAQHGLKGARIQAIVRRAGVNERMIYHHFGSKTGLYHAVVADQRAGVAELWLPALSRVSGTSPYDGMREALLGLLGAFQQRPLLLALLVHEWLAGTRNASFPTEEELPSQLRELYERGQRDGTFPAEVPFAIAYGVAIGSLVALTVFAPRFFEGIGIDADATLGQHVVDQLLNGMTG